MKNYKGGTEQLKGSLTLSEVSKEMITEFDVILGSTCAWTGHASLGGIFEATAECFVLRFEKEETQC